MKDIDIWVPSEEKEYPRIYPKCRSPSWDNARKIEWKNNDMSFKDKGNYYNDTIRVFL